MQGPRRGADPVPMQGPLPRVVRGIVILLLVASAAVVLLRLHDLAMTRYFTVDEFQFGHAAWLVSRGRVPYADFYEHHFPASYVLHAPLVAGDAPFPERALRLREAAFSWLLLACLGLGAGTFYVLRDPLAALLAAQLPAAFGFSALSVVDFRADNLAAQAWLVCLLLLESNRRRGSTALAVCAGLLLALAVLSTQKLVLLGAVPVALWLVADVWRRRLRRDAGPPFVCRPLSFLVAAGTVGGVALLLAVALGMLGPGFEATVAHAVAHEAHYPDVRLLAYVTPFLRETALTTVPILAFAAVGVAAPYGRFFALPLAVAVAAGLWMRGQFPYNYVFACMLAVLLAVRGFAFLIARGASRWPSVRPFAPLLYLLPLLVIPDQLGFAEGRTSNAHQLHLLAKIERFTSPGDAVIDDAGGALFRDHASYYYYHGPAHRAVLADYFDDAENGLLRDLRESRAPLWIRDFRLSKLAPEVRRYFDAHYVRADGWLYALGVATPASGEAGLERDLDVIRGGTWHAWPAPGGNVAPAGDAHGVRVDGRPVPPEGLRLEEGRHRVAVAPDAPPMVLTPLPRALFLERFERMRPYAMLFEYERRPDHAWRRRTVLTP